MYHVAAVRSVESLEVRIYSSVKGGSLIVHFMNLVSVAMILANQNNFC